MPRIVCVSDTHNCNEKIIVPDGDILIHAGDATSAGSVDEITVFNRWFASLPHKHKIFVPGNHDWLFERNEPAAASLLDESITYLRDSSAEISGLTIFGSPWQPKFYDWAFNLSRGAELAEKWARIPDEVEILITHGPPQGILDLVPTRFGESHEGCEELRERVERISFFGRLDLHVFGHIHCGYGTHEEFGVKFVNASTCDEQYCPIQPPIVIDL